MTQKTIKIVPEQATDIDNNFQGEIYAKPWKKIYHQQNECLIF